MNDYKAQSERTDEAERLLTPAIRRGAVNTEPEKRDAFVAKLIGPKYPEIQVELVGGSGNAFAIIGAVRKALRRAGIAPAEQEAFTKEATSGDYDKVLQTAMAWVDVS